MTTYSEYSLSSLPETHSVQIASTKEDRLSDLRWRLRGEIAKMVHEKEGSQLLEETKESYNRAIDALRDLKINQRIDPMERLPHEIITKILLEVTNTWYSSRDMEDVLSLTMVSKYWQMFILSEPLLWNRLSLGKQYDGRALAFLQLQLSRDLPLALTVQLPLSEWDDTRAELVKHRDRIETIVCRKLNQRFQGISGEKLNILGLLNDLGPLPNLKHVRAWDHQYSGASQVNIMLERFPSIEEISNIPFTIDELRSVEGRLTMGLLVTYVTPHALLSMIQSFRNLKFVRFIDQWPSSRIESRPEESSLEETSLPSPLGWIELTCYQRHSRIFAFLPYCFSSLVTLEIAVDLETLYNMLKYIQEFVKLYKVEISVIAPHDSRISPPSDICANMCVSSLDLSIYCLEYITPDQVPMDSEQIAGKLMQLPQLLHCAMPKVAYLSLIIYDWSHLFPGLSMGDWFNGETLHLYFISCKFTPGIDIHLPSSVKNLSLYSRMGLIHSFRSSSLKSLSFT
ncbi:hypothetical protein CPB86DRAFT_876187 [Serendipita vermifera]|nr:hypothetical protein CPB86DRAFT_876187 [Serendipita vermifera]